MEWQEILNNKYIQNLPFKFEQDQWGNAIMSPATNLHGFFQSFVCRILGNYEIGVSLTEASIETRKGVKVPDVVWMSKEFFKEHEFTTPYVKSPEICVEVLSPSNSTKEILAKKNLYFERGCKEVWICSADGDMSFYTSSGKIKPSKIFPDFPLHISKIQ